MTPALPPPLRTPVFPEWWPAEQLRGNTVPGTACPRITVVTPSFNQGAYLESTLRSVLGQNYPNLEYIVVDGGSKDESLEIIRHYEKHLTWWVSEPDSGQADAILKGLSRSTGEWFNWINSDDLLAPGALWNIAAATPDADAVSGAVVNFTNRGRRVKKHSRQLDLHHMIFHHLGGGAKYHQPGIWLRKDLVLQAGIDRNRHYKFDYELLLRYLNRFPRVRYIPDALAFFRLHEQSKTVTQGRQHISAFNQERAAILLDLAREPGFAEHRSELELAARQCNWLIELVRYKSPFQSRWHGLAQLWEEVREDPEARCVRASRKIALQLLRKGLWPHFLEKETRRRL